MSKVDDPPPEDPAVGRMELALKASNEGIWDWWTDSRKIYYSRRILEFLECGGRNAPHIFLPPHEVVHEDEREDFERALRRALDPAGSELFSVDCRLRTGSGGWCWLRIRGSVVRDSSGKTTRIAGSMIDISRRKAAEAQIEEDRHLLRMLIDHVPLQVYFKDTESRFFLANRQLAEWMGLDHPSQLIGRHDREFFVGEHSQKTIEDERRIMDTGEALTGQLERETWEGKKDTWVLTSKFPWRARDGRIRGTFGVSSDVTELILAQERVAGLAAELAQRNEVYEEEVQLAREIQQALSSTGFPVIRHNDRQLIFGSRYLPISGLAGDFFEVVRIGERMAGLLICDVMGHGVRSALVVAMLRGLLEKQRDSAGDPGAFLGGLNKGLSAILQRADATMFATAFYAVVDLDASELRYACAGHPAALVIRNDGVEALAAARDERGPGLGIVANSEFPTLSKPLEGIERMLLFTDGILEAENSLGEPYLERRLKENVAEWRGRSLQSMLDGVIESVLNYSEDHTFDDDVCILGFDVSSA
ncbi:MAG: SpoIIE family protein phosphatase [Verrucomicrobiales bacterium]